MSRNSLSAAWLLGAVITVACSSGGDKDGSGSISSGSAASAIEDPGGAQAGGPSGTGDSDGLISLDDPTGTGVGGGDLGDGTGGTSSTEVDGTGGTTDTEIPASGGDGQTTDPGPETGGTTGSTTDPPPVTTGGTTGSTTDPPPGETEDPPPGETEDPPPGETEDPPPGETEDPPPGETEDPPPGETEDPPPGETVDPPPVDECIPTEMTDVNVIVFKDAAPSGADSEGRMYVGGDASFDGYAIASREEVDCSSWGLVVGGDLSVSGGSVSTGKIAVGGTYTTVGSGFTAGCGVWEGEEPVDFDELEARMIAYSEAMAAYPENGESEVKNGSLYLTGTDPDLNVFSVTATELANNIILDVKDGSSVIVNVSGTDIVWSGKGFELPDGGAACRGETSDWCHSIMYNMYEATSLELSGIGVQGSIMAPYATFTGNGGNVDGQVIVQYLYGGIEFHPYFFSGCLLLPEVSGAT